MNEDTTKEEMCAMCKDTPVYAEGEKYCNECWYYKHFEDEE